MSATLGRNPHNISQDDTEFKRKIKDITSEHSEKGGEQEINEENPAVKPVSLQNYTTQKRSNFENMAKINESGVSLLYAPTPDLEDKPVFSTGGNEDMLDFDKTAKLDKNEMKKSSVPSLPNINTKGN